MLFRLAGVRKAVAGADGHEQQALSGPRRPRQPRVADAHHPHVPGGLRAGAGVHGARHAGAVPAAQVDDYQVGEGLRGAAAGAAQAVRGVDEQLQRQARDVWAVCVAVFAVKMPLQDTSNEHEHPTKPRTRLEAKQDATTGSATVVETRRDGLGGEGVRG